MKEENKELIREVIEGLRKLLKESDSELEVGKWYWVNRQIHRDIKALVWFQGFGKTTYGFDHCGDYCVDYGAEDTFSNPDYKYTEATHKEIESALIEEAKRRYKVGDKISILDEHNFGNFDDDTNRWIIRDINDPFYSESTGFLFYGNLLIYDNGEWATVIEEDKFAELKEAHKNGAVIQYRPNDKYRWSDTNCPLWTLNCEYRIKPEPKVGDVVSARPTLHTSKITMNVYNVEKLGEGIYQINGLGVTDVTVLETDEEILNSIK